MGRPFPFSAFVLALHLVLLIELLMDAVLGVLDAEVIAGNGSSRKPWNISALRRPS